MVPVSFASFTVKSWYIKLVFRPPPLLTIKYHTLTVHSHFAYMQSCSLDEIYYLIFLLRYRISTYIYPPCIYTMKSFIYEHLLMSCAAV